MNKTLNILLHLVLILMSISCSRTEYTVGHFRERVARESSLTEYTLNPYDRQRADDALEHRFFVMKSHEPLFYGEDIDWTLNPYGEDEMRWQLHRRYWFSSLCRMYAETGDERYAAEWRAEFLDWAAKNPVPDVAPANTKASIALAGNPLADVALWPDENSRYAWRPLEVCARIGGCGKQFFLTLSSEGTDDEFVKEFLRITREHCNFLDEHYSASGNHRLFQANAMLTVANYFPELKEAAAWRKHAIEILNEEINKQVYADGVQKELDPHYHAETIDIFIESLALNKSSFPSSYLETVRKMIDFHSALILPDWSLPLFADNRAISPDELCGKYSEWQKAFPEDETIKWIASKGKDGQKPAAGTRLFKDGGFYVMRTGWDDSSTVLIVKDGPSAGWHNQPDNGTFELFVNGRNLFPDSGCYMYGGDESHQAQREWFRRSASHKTLTIDGLDHSVQNGRFSSFSESDGICHLVITDTPYEGIEHERTFDFSENLLTITDRVSGPGSGNAAIHYQFRPNSRLTCKDGAVLIKEDTFPDVTLKVSSPCGNVTMQKEEGWVSYLYGEKQQRPAYSFNITKPASQPITFLTQISFPH